MRQATALCDGETLRAIGAVEDRVSSLVGTKAPARTSFRCIRELVMRQDSEKDYPDPSADEPGSGYGADGVDVTLIRWMLSLSPAERLDVLQKNVRSIEELRGS